MSEVLAGVIHGKTIELQADPGMTDGQKIEVVIRPMPEPRAWGDGVLASAGALAHLPPEVFEELEMIVRERKRERPRVVAE